MIIVRVNGAAAPQGSKRVNAHGAIYESSAAVKPWREAVRAETQRAVAADRLGVPYGKDEAIEVSLLFLLARPRGHYRAGQSTSHLLREGAPVRPRSRPDIDKLTRAVLDGLTAGGAYADDCQIADLIVSEDYVDAGEVPGCLIRVELATVVPWVDRDLFRYPDSYLSAGAL